MTAAMPVLPLTVDEVLTTTRSVRRRLDLSRPVARPVIEEYGLTPLSLEEAVQELTAAWLRAMAPPRHRRTTPVTSKRAAG